MIEGFEGKRGGRNNISYIQTDMSAIYEYLLLNESYHGPAFFSQADELSYYSHQSGLEAS